MSDKSCNLSIILPHYNSSNRQKYQNKMPFKHILFTYYVSDFACANFPGVPIRTNMMEVYFKKSYVILTIFK